MSRGGFESHPKHFFCTVGFAYAVGIGVGWVAFVVNEVDTLPSVLLAGFVAAYMVIGGVALGLVPVYETSRSRHFAWQEVIGRQPDADSEGPSTPASANE